MLSKINRLTKKKDFEKVFKNGRSSYDKIIGIKCSPGSIAITRFGILVGLKVCKKAVIRNKVRRRIRESLRPLLARLRPGYDCIVIALPGIAEKDFKQISGSLEKNLKNLRLLDK